MSLTRACAAALAASLALAVWLCPVAADDAASKAPAADPAVAKALAIDQKLMADAKAGSEIMKNLTYLSDVIGPRLTGSANAERANTWTAEVMKSYGLENVKLEAWELPAGWERGPASARLIEPDNGRTLSIAAMGWTPGTKGKITGDVVFINARTPEDLKQYQGKLKGAIVLRSAPTPVRPITELNPTPQQRPGGAGGRGDAANPTAGEKPADSAKPGEAAKPGEPAKPGETAKPGEAAKPGEQPPPGGGRPGGFDNRGFGEQMRFRREIGEFLRKEGVAAMLVDAGKPHNLLNMTGTFGGQDRASATAAEPLPTIFVAHEHYALLHRLATRPAPAKTRMELEVNNKTIPGPLTVYNTVGEIRGSEKPDEYVVVGAHLDSWDLGQGTTDNGTGTCVILETARLLAKSGMKFRRTIRFALFTGEEQGLHGSKAYVRAHKDDMARTTAAIIHDTGTGKVTGVSLMGRIVLEPIMKAEMASLKDLGVTEITPRSSGGSDHQSFEGVGVPGFFFRQDPAEYRLTHHSQSDTLDKAREPDLVQGAQVTAVLAARLANRGEMLPRDKPPPMRGGRFGEQPRTEEPKKEEPKKEEKKP